MGALAAVAFVLGFPCMLAAAVWNGSGEKWADDMLKVGAFLWTVAGLLLAFHLAYNLR